jgi:hypothetical protein
MVTQMLFNLDGAAAGPFAEIFSDVGPDDWFAACIGWAVQNGVAAGKGAAFDPNGPVTREQLALFLYNYAKYKGFLLSAPGELSVFTDAGQVSDWVEEAMRWAVGEGLFEGFGDGTLAPGGFATRAQVAAVLQRFCEKFTA